MGLQERESLPPELLCRRIRYSFQAYASSANTHAPLLGPITSAPVAML
jgi:hypothetical protein